MNSYLQFFLASSTRFVRGEELSINHNRIVSYYLSKNQDMGIKLFIIKGDQYDD